MGRSPNKIGAIEIEKSTVLTDRYAYKNMEMGTARWTFPFMRNQFLVDNLLGPGSVCPSEDIVFVSFKI
jgi:hypothetical protein